jgi:hypothetical protein
MEIKNTLIRRIIFSIDKNQFNAETLDVIIKIKSNNNHHNTLNKINTINNVNIYETQCSIEWNSLNIIIKLQNDILNDVLEGKYASHILENNIGHNHINDMCGNICHPKKYEVSHSIYRDFYKKSAVNLFVDPLKYPDLVSLVLFEFLKINDYPQDIKNNILLLYNDVT